MSQLWNRLRNFYRVCLPIRFSFITVAVLAFTFILADQGHDIIAYLAEDDPGAKARTGARVLFLLLVALFALQVWYFSRQLLRVKFPEQPDPADFPWAVTWIPRLLGLIVFFIIIAGLALVRREYGDKVDQPAETLLWMIIVVAIEAVLFFIAVWLRRKWLHKRNEHTTEQKESVRHLGGPALTLLALHFLLGLVLLLASIFAVQRVGKLGSFSIVIIALGLWVVLGGAVVYIGMKLRIPILTWLLLFAIIISPCADNHKVENIAGTQQQVSTRKTTDELFQAWLAARGGGAGQPVFIVATEGGGIRAAYWTATVLSSLTDTIPGFTDHLFAISAVSGGSVGSATYRSLLAEQKSFEDKIRPRARGVLAYDALAPTLAAFTQQDFLQRFIPFPFLPDRAEALTGGWEEGWREVVKTERFQQGFLATARANEERMPALFLNGTSVETGERMIASNARIDENFAAAVDMFEATGFDMRMSTGALNSARFTYVSPAGTLLRNPEMPKGPGASTLDCDAGDPCDHVVDGGYFENSGAVTAADVLRIVQKYPQVRPHVIFITYRGTPAPVKPETVANELLSPLRAILNTRGARGEVAVEQLKAQVGGPANFTNFQLIQHPDEAQFPLGWLLSLRTRNLIDMQMPGTGPDSNQPNVDRIAGLLATAPQTDAVYSASVQAEAQQQKKEQ